VDIQGDNNYFVMVYFVVISDIYLICVKEVHFITIMILFSPKNPCLTPSVRGTRPAGVMMYQL